MKEGPNKAPEPTTTAVTPRAIALSLFRTHVLLVHASRRLWSWLIFDVGQRRDLPAMSSPKRKRAASGRELVKKWSLPVGYALFHQDGTFYADVKSFPVALCDCTGFVVATTSDELRHLRGVVVYEARISVRDGVSRVPGYQKCPAGLAVQPT